jgi:hypothetical protein
MAPTLPELMKRVVPASRLAPRRRTGASATSRHSLVFRSRPECYVRWQVPRSVLGLNGRRVECNVKCLTRMGRVRQTSQHRPALAAHHHCLSWRTAVCLSWVKPRRRDMTHDPCAAVFRSTADEPVGDRKRAALAAALARRRDADFRLPAKASSTPQRAHADHRTIGATRRDEHRDGRVEEAPTGAATAIA